MSETDHITDDLGDIRGLDADDLYEDGIDDWRYWYTPEEMRRHRSLGEALDRERAATSPVYRRQERIYALDVRVPEQAAERARLEEEICAYWRSGEWTRIDTYDMSCDVGHAARLDQNLRTYPELYRDMADHLAQRRGFARIEELLALLRANEQRWGLPLTEPWL